MKALALVIALAAAPAFAQLPTWGAAGQCLMQRSTGSNLTPMWGDCGMGAVDQLLQHGKNTFSLGSRTVTFDVAFAAAPTCVCSITVGSAVACGAGTSSTTGVIFYGLTTNTFSWICIGTKP